ncbi:MAG: methyltransferase [Candidatus Micrarchaeota archaeon]|nr:methyltransferase [Candidatus Micrarchaeota archaeon]MDE1848352.1 methyltransferase [Candidatus Micrarchaeota archaeon]MDE1864798.1 methyltransferase [Candidatus Micrarchaeota archaeon]
MISEGKARVEQGAAFYNPKMAGLRDLSVAFLRAMEIKRYSLLDSTAATGIRGIRYALESGAGNITMLDINKSAYLSAKANAKKNGVKATVLNTSIQEFCNTEDESFDVIDLDPFGSAAPYIYDLMKAAKDNTLLMATATDTAVLCGASPLACIKTYGSQPLHNELCHEVGTRILINFVSRIAAQFNFGIEVKIAIANLHYIRIFLVLHHGADKAVESIKQTGFGSFCSKCRAFGYSNGIAPKLDGRCANCKSETQLFGPLWLGSTYDHALIRKMKMLMPKNIDRGTSKLVEIIDSELDIPFFYSIPKLTRRFGIGSVSKKKMIEKLGRKYKVSETHFDTDGIKTDSQIGGVERAVKSAGSA